MVQRKYWSEPQLFSEHWPVRVPVLCSHHQVAPWNEAEAFEPEVRQKASKSSGDEVSSRGPAFLVKKRFLQRGRQEPDFRVRF